MKMLVGLSTILAGIAVGIAMTGGVIAVPFVGTLVNQAAGWIVIAGGIIEGLKMFGIKLM